MRFAVLYYVPWYKRAKLNGWFCTWYHPTFRLVWKHWLVSLGIGGYEETTG